MEVGVYTDESCTQHPTQSWLRLSSSSNYTDAYNNTKEPLDTYIKASTILPTQLKFYLYKEPDNFQFEEVNTLDIEKTKSYYNQIRSEDLCDCDYCRNNIHEVKAAYPTSFIDTP